MKWLIVYLLSITTMILYVQGTNFCPTFVFPLIGIHIPVSRKQYVPVFFRLHVPELPLPWQKSSFFLSFFTLSSAIFMKIYETSGRVT
jgi:hypothetical protein